MKKKFFSVLFALVLVLSFSLVTAVPVAASPDAIEIDGVISTGEWDGAVEIPVASEMGTVKLLASTGYLYVLFEVQDSTDARFGENQVGNDKFGLNINPTDGGPWGKPCDIVFQTGADPDAFTTPDPDIEGSSGNTDYWKTEWVIDGVQLDLPEDIETMTLYSGGTRRISEWKVPLASIAPSPGDILKVGGACDIDVGVGSYSYPPDIAWADEATYEDYSFKVENETTGLYYTTIQGAIDAADTGDTVNVAAGTYNEAVTIDKQLTLLGAQHGVDPTVDGGRVGNESTIENNGITIMADSVTVDGFTVTNAPINAIHVNGFSRNTITNNILSDNVRHGVAIYYSDSNTIASNVMTGNGRGTGLFVDHADNNIIENNVISHSVSADPQPWEGGIRVGNSDGNTITGNTLSDQYQGIAFGYVATNNIITYNTIKNNTRGIFLRDKGGNDTVSGSEAHYNNIVGNTEYGVLNEFTDETFDATNNWWGDETGPEHATLNPGAQGDAVSENVDFSPWLYETQEKFIPGEPCYAGSVVLQNEATKVVVGDTTSWKGGWNTFSTPILLDDSADTVSGLLSLAEDSGLVIERAQRFDLTSDGPWVLLATPAGPTATGEDYQIKPGEGFFIQVSTKGSLPILCSTILSPPQSWELSEGWNLVGAPSYVSKAAEDAFSSLGATCTVVSSPGANPASWSYPPATPESKVLLPGRAYWVAMSADGTLMCFDGTPVADDLTWELNQ